MKKLSGFIVSFVFLSVVAGSVFADTPPPGTVKAKMFSGDGNTAATLQSNGALNVNVTGGSGLTSTVNQGTAGSSSWLASITASALPTNACQETGGHLSSIDSKLTAPLSVTGPLTDSQLRATAVPISGSVTVSGTITATNSANGNPGSSAPAQATQIGGSDGTNLRAVKVSSTGVVAVDGSASTQPISAASLPLPALAATSTKQDAIITALGDPFQVGDSIGNTAFGISGTLPAFAATPTFNLGTLNGAATATLQSSTITALGSPFQAGGSIGNTAFGISGTLPAFAATPTFNLGTLNGAATASAQATGNASLSSIDGKTPALGQALAASSVPVVLTASQLSTLTPLSTVAATQSGSWSTGRTWSLLNSTDSVNAVQSGTWTVTLGSLGGAATAANQSTEITALGTINTTLGSPFQAGGSIANTAFGISGTLPAFASTPTFNLGTLNGAATAANQTTEIGSLATIATNSGTQATAANQTTGNSSLSTIATNSGTQATAANQTTGNSSLSTIATNTTNAATTTLQTTGNTSLSTIATNTGNIPAKGLAGVSGSAPVALPNATTVTTTAFNSTTGTLNTDMLTGSASGWYDAAGYAWFGADIYTTTTVTGGVITFEQTNDTTNDAAGITMNLQDSSVITQTNVTSLTLAASTIKHYQAPITARYIRFRISTAFAGTGTVGATLNLRQTPYVPVTVGVAQATAASLATTATIASGTVTTVSTVSSVTSDNLAIPGIVADVASAAITTTTTTATLTPTNGVGYLVQIPVTVVSGTTPTYSVAVQESADTGTNWTTVYTFPTITVTGFYVSPPLFFRGNRVRYVQTLTGTTPSFTRAINRLQMSAVAAAPVNNNASMVTSTVGTSCSTLTAPANSVAFILENLSSNTVNMFWSIGATLATSTTGMLLEPGRDTGEVHSGQNVTLCSASSTPTYAIQWVQQ